MNYQLLVLALIFSFSNANSQEIDNQFAESLKIEANHNLNRLKSLKEEENNNKVYDREREKGLADFLEEQERWDLLRDRGLSEYRKQKRLSTPREGSAEHLEYLEQKESDDARYERFRNIHVKTRQQVGLKSDETIAQLESQELGLLNLRPRYELRKRSLNKWIATGSTFKGSGSSTSTFVPTSPANDFTPVSDFPAAPPPFEPLPEEPQFAPVPVYDSNNGGIPYDTGMGGEINIPPPPPPPPDFDF